MRGLILLFFASVILIFTQTSTALTASTAEASKKRNHGEVTAARETEPVGSKGDAADDVTVWVDSAQPSQSMIVATDKKRGLLLYSLAGEKLGEYAVGKVNNIDSRADVRIDGRKTHLLVGSDRSANSIAFYTASRKPLSLETIGAIELSDEPYGICVGQFAEDALDVFVTSKAGPVDHWSVRFDKDGMKATNRGRIAIASKTEGCVVDDATRQLFVSEEAVGVWRIDLMGGAGPSLIDAVKPNGHLVADVEGLAIHRSHEGEAQLVVSSQGDSSFHVYDLVTHRHVGAFVVVAGNGIDGVSDTDGIEVVSQALDPAFPNGFMIVQDGENTDSTGKHEKQNFKIIDWNSIPVSN